MTRRTYPTQSVLNHFLFPLLLPPLLILGTNCARPIQPRYQADRDTVQLDTSPVETGVHPTHQKLFQSYDLTSPEEWDSLHGITHHPDARTASKPNPSFKVFGWHPHYMGTAFRSYNFNLLWAVSYFSYEVNPSTGSYSSIHDWKETELIDLAKKSGTKVFLTATNFGADQNTEFLENPAAQKTFADSIVHLLQERDGNGVTVDFEDVPEDQAENFTRFILDLSDHLKQANPNFMISITLPGIDWHSAYRAEKMIDAVDLFIVMGYDYYYSGSKVAGPVAPLESGDLWEPYNLESTLRYYLNKGIPKKQLLIASPYYGREWKTAGTTIPSSATASLGSHLYRDIRQTIDSLSLTPEVDTVSWSRYIARDVKESSQLWFDDSLTLGEKWDWIIRNDLGGIGIWALGYDNGYADLWELLESKFGK